MMREFSTILVTDGAGIIRLNFIHFFIMEAQFSVRLVSYRILALLSIVIAVGIVRCPEANASSFSDPSSSAPVSGSSPRRVAA